MTNALILFGKITKKMDFNSFKTKIKRKPTEYFNILIVPRNSANIKRMAVSRVTLKYLAAALSLAAFFILGGAIALISYRHSYLASEDARINAAEFARERAGLIGRVAELEGTLSRIERFASKLESSMAASLKDDNKQGVVGRGPVEEESWLSIPEKIFSPNRYNLSGNAWKSPFNGILGKGLKLKLDDLSERLDVTEARVHSVFAMQKDKLYFWASLPSVWPTKGWVTSEFGAIRGWGGYGRVHEGIDIAAPRGTPIVAPGNGIVTYTGYRRGYGNTVKVDHGYGITTVFAHCSSLFAQEGQQVKRGMIIAAVGNTGRSTGPHLHYEVRIDDTPINPRLYVMNDN